jgi:GNAT superfamily N-acetyltransferase
VKGPEPITKNGQRPSPADPEVLRIRIATAADMPAMIEVTNAAFAVEVFIEGTRTDEARMAEAMRSGEFLLAEDDAGRILACVYTAMNGERGYFGMLSVDPACKGKGLGRKMVEAAEMYCRERNCKFMDIDVLSLRPELPPFYRKLGYAESGRGEFHPSRPLKAGFECHVIKMSKAL